jgi:hypothetical protein
MTKYLISAMSYISASEIAKNMELKNSEYIYIPHMPEVLRDLKLKGFRDVNKKYLVGYYNNREWKNITGCDK